MKIQSHTCTILVFSSYTQTTLICMLQFLLSSSSSYRSSCTSAKSHPTTTVQLLMVHSHLRGVPRIGCTAQSCFSCNEAKAECFHNTSNTSHPLLTLQHVLFNLVNLASIVLEHLQVQPQVKISLFILCFKLPPRRTCQKAITIVSNVF